MLAIGSVVAPALACSSLLGLRDDYVVGAADGSLVGADGEVEAEPPREIRGRIAVHAPGPDASVRAFAIIGDGTKIPAKEVDADGRAEFVDASIFGPQDVTLVLRTTEGTTVKVSVMTYVGVAQSEVWFGRWQKRPRIGSVGGRVTASGDMSNVWLTTNRADFHASNLHPNPGGGFTTDLDGPGGGLFRLVAWRSAAGPRPNVLLQAGASSPLYVANGSAEDAGDIALDHTLVESLSFGVQGAEPYGPGLDVDVAFLPETAGPTAFVRPAAVVDGGAYSASSIELSASFEGWKRFLHVKSSSSRPIEAPSVEAFAPYGPLVTLFPPTPLFRPRNDAGAVSVARNDLALEASPIPAEVGTAGVFLAAQIASDAFEWTILRWATTDPVRRFTFFDLPKDVLDATLPPGDYRAAIKTVRSPAHLGDEPGAMHAEDLVRAGAQATVMASSGYQRITLTP